MLGSAAAFFIAWISEGLLLMRDHGAGDAGFGLICQSYFGRGYELHIPDIQCTILAVYKRSTRMRVIPMEGLADGNRYMAH